MLKMIARNLHLDMCSRQAVQNYMVSSGNSSRMRKALPISSFVLWHIHPTLNSAGFLSMVSISALNCFIKILPNNQGRQLK